MFFQIICLGLLFFADSALGSCGICQSNFVACHSETTFSLCIEGNPTHSIVTCPMGTICTDGPRVCVSKIDESVRPSCITGCGTCGSYRNVFSCLSKTEFGFCFGEPQPFQSYKGTCLNGYVCELSSQKICVPYASSKPSCDEGPPLVPTDSPTTTSEPTESSTTTLTASTSVDPTSTDQISTSASEPTESSTTTLTSSTSVDPTSTNQASTSTTEATTTEKPVDTTTPAPRDASTFCAQTKKQGNFKAEGDTTCTKFFYCVEYSGVFYGTEHACPGSKFFNSILVQCQESRPSDC